MKQLLKLRTLISIMIGYGAYYLVRANFASTVKEICTDLSISKAKIGIIMAIGSLIYGCVKFLFGFLCEKYKPKYILSIGLILCGILNILMGETGSIITISILYILNQAIQGTGAAPCVKLMKAYFNPTEMGRIWTTWSVASHASTALIIAISPFIIMHYGWQMMFYLPGVLTILLAIFVFFITTDSTGNYVKSKAFNIIKTWHLIIKNKYVLAVSFAGLFVYINKMTFLNWGLILLREGKGNSLITSGINMVLFEISSMIGGVTLGYISDKFFRGRRGPVAALNIILLTIFMLIFLLVPKSLLLLQSICMTCIGFLISAPAMLVGVASTDFVNKEIAPAANGFTSTICALGSALAGYINGIIADIYGWNGVILFLLISSVCATSLFIYLWNAKPIKS